MLKKSLLIFLGILLISISCTNKKNLVYFQGSIDGNSTSINYSPTLKSDDVVSINVISIDESAAKPFNLPLSNSSQNNGGYTQGVPSPPGYLIDAEGNIDFPVIGRVKLAGLSRHAAIELLKAELKPYLNNPTIIMRILNYKVTVLGEVKNPGTFTIPNERITLLEAIGIAGDLNITGKRKNVLVIRDEGGKKTETRIDLTSKSIFSSPFYYLQQNDVVYVEPNRAKINSSAINTANTGLVISVISLLVTISVLLFTAK